MRRAHRAGWVGAARFCAVAAVVSALVAGCGTVRAADSPPGRSSAIAAGVTVPVSGGGPPAGSRAAALALARQLLSHLVLPPGARPAPVSSALGPLLHPQLAFGGAYSADLRRLFRLRQPMTATYRFLTTHVPAGMRLESSGQAGRAAPSAIPGPGPAGAHPHLSQAMAGYVSYALRSLPRGIYRAELATAIVPAGSGDGSLLRADTQVTWFPPRSAAEHLDPAGFRAVTLRVTEFNPQIRTVTRTFTSRPVIARLAAIIDGLPAAPYQPPNCPVILPEYRLTFTAPAGPAHTVVASPTGCLTVQVTAGQKAQPLLWDSGKLIAAISRLRDVLPRPARTDARMGSQERNDGTRI